MASTPIRISPQRSPEDYDEVQNSGRSQGRFGPQLTDDRVQADSYSRVLQHSTIRSPTLRTERNEVHDVQATLPTPGAAPQLSHTNSFTQKRPYRQRRKDPSCDACRERKVKCDATDLKSCTECMSRNVACQFTKDTNRRMSSLKQVQDLERQVLQMKQENNELRETIGEMSTESNSKKRISSQADLPPSIVPSFSTEQKPFSLPDILRVRMDLKRYSRGLFSLPPSCQSTRLDRDLGGLRPELPPRHVGDYLVHTYRKTMHESTPILHWPTFEHDYTETYRTGTLQGAPRIWSSVLLAVFAIGAIFATDLDIRRPGMEKHFAEMSMNIVNPFVTDPSLDHVRQAFLMSVIFAELNLIAMSRAWLAKSIALSQSMGLHCERNAPTVENEMRRRVWWSIYTRDRLCSLETSQPLLIQDADCDVLLPTAVDDRYLHLAGASSPQSTLMSTSLLLPLIHVARLVPKVLATISKPPLRDETLSSLEAQFHRCVSTFPPELHFSSQNYLDVRNIGPVLALTNAKFTLHRHNMSPACPMSLRIASIAACMDDALDSVSILRRVVFPGTDATSQDGNRSASAFGAIVSTTILMHAWRCALILIFTEQYDAAMVILRFFASTSGSCDTNIACNRYLIFYLETLLSKRRQGFRRPWEEDEEVMVYTSGDLQANAGNGWVWFDSRPNSTSDRSRSSETYDIPDEAGTPSSSSSFGLDVKESDWRRTENLLHSLIAERPDSSQGHAPDVMEGVSSTYGGSGNAGMNPGAVPLSRSAPLPAVREISEQTAGSQQQPTPSSRSSNRISIANII